MIARAVVLFLIGALMSVSLTLKAQDSAATYFQNLGLTPVAGASRALINQEPAAVLVFSASAGSADATALFDTWVNKTSRTFRGAAFGVVHKPSTMVQEILDEVLTQRELQFPVFATETDLLAGREFRLMVVAGGLSYDIPGLDFAALDAELAKHAGAAAAEPTPAATPAASQATPVATPPAPEPTPAATPPGTPLSAADIQGPGDPVATPAAPPIDGTPAEPAVGFGRYYNSRFGITVDFPRGWAYRVARNNDGAVGRAPAGRNMDLRVWALPNGTPSDGSGGLIGVSEYIEEHLNLISEQTSSRVGILQRFRVDDEGVRGYDYTYSFSRAVAAPGVPAPSGRSPLVLHRGRIQAFETDGVIKVVSAEAPSGEFERAGPIIEEFIQTFHPFLADDDGNPIPSVPDEAADGVESAGPGAR